MLVKNDVGFICLTAAECPTTGCAATLKPIRSDKSYKIMMPLTSCDKESELNTYYVL